jgi:hypothetical protein
VTEPEPEIPEDEDVIERCGNPCPEAPDLDPCLLPRGHAFPWHRNRSSSWQVAGDGGGA